MLENNSMMKIRRGDVFFADLDPVMGSEQGGVRPVLIIQNDVGNQHSPTTIIAAITGQLCKAKLPTHVDLAGKEHGLAKHSVVLVEQVRTIDKTRLKERICSLDKAIMEQVDIALEVSMGLRLPFSKESIKEGETGHERAEREQHDTDRTTEKSVESAGKRTQLAAQQSNQSR